ncbi:MFS transporter [Streptomyces sp. NPDC002187]|uniref:MFS transporter n=1 Tax=Streptomyces sp. NPDC002187 TaxID=3364637 RepID=UPI0036C281A6
MLSNIPTPLLGIWQDRMGFSTGTTTVIFAAYIGGLLVALPFTGVLADRFGRRKVLVPALVVALVSCPLFMSAHHVADLLLARFLTGLAVGAAVSAGTAAVVEVAGPDRRATAALAGSAGIGLGLATGPLLGGGVSQFWGAPTVTVFALEIILLLSALAVVFAVLPPGAGQGTQRTWMRLPSVPRPHRNSLAAALVAYMPGMTGTSLILALGPSLLTNLLHSTNRLVAGGIGCVMFGTSTGIQFAIKKMSVRRVLTSAGLLTGMGMLGAVAAVCTRSLTLFVGAAVLAGAGQGMSQLGGFTLLGSSVPKCRLAEANAALSAGGYLFAGVLPIVTGYASDAVGMTTSTTVFASVTAAAAITGALMIRQILQPPGSGSGQHPLRPQRRARHTAEGNLGAGSGR